MGKELNEETLKDFLTKLASSFDEYDYYNDILFNGEEIMDLVFKDYISEIEGSPCCADKSGFIVRRIKKALKERTNIPLGQTYAEYRDNGGNLGGINENNTDLNEICYWCPKTIKDTDSAIKLYIELLNVPRYVRSQVKDKDQQLAELKAENERLKEKTLSEREWQNYCAYKIIEPQIKGCLDREREYQQQLKEKDEEIERLKNIISISNEKLLLNTKQVCEKIRKLCKDCWEVKEYKSIAGTTLQGIFNKKKFLQEVDQIEKGE